MQNVLNHVSDRSSHLTNFSAFSPWQYHPGDDVIRDVPVLFTCAEAKVEMIWFDTLVSDQNSTLLHVLRINQVSEQTSGLRLKF